MVRSDFLRPKALRRGAGLEVANESRGRLRPGHRRRLLPVSVWHQYTHEGTLQYKIV